MHTTSHNQRSASLIIFLDFIGLLTGNEAAKGGVLQQLIRIRWLGERNGRRRIVHCALTGCAQVHNLLFVREHMQRGLRLKVYIDGALLGLATRQPDQAMQLGQIAALIDGQRHIWLEDVHWRNGHEKKSVKQGFDRLLQLLTFIVACDGSYQIGERIEGQLPHGELEARLQTECH